MISDNHPITPPPELIRQWLGEHLGRRAEIGDVEQVLANKSARWGADLQLEICLKWFQDHGCEATVRDLRRHCRPPKPQPPQTVVIDGHTYRLEE